MKRLYQVRGQKGRCVVFTFAQLMLVRLFPFIAKWSWTWKKAFGRYYGRFLRKWIQSLYLWNGFALTGYLDKACIGLECWGIEALIPGHWTMEDIARASFREGYKVKLELKPLENE